MSDTTIPGFNRIDSVGSAAIKRPVYVTKAGHKPLIALHELPGMSPSFLEFCNRMAKKEFKVYAPLLFKSPNSEMGFVRCSAFCLSREFRSLFYPHGTEPKARPFTAWLLELVDYVADKNRQAKIGVVGMCLTGNFAIAAIARPNVDAAIVCQPSYPFVFSIKSLGLSDAQRRSAIERAESLPSPCAKGYRYRNDIVSRDSHMKAIEDVLKDSFERYRPSEDSPVDVPGWKHSTLTTKSKSGDVFDDVVRFLNARL